MPKKLSPEALQFLYVQEWHGNVRELENMLERATILSDKAEIGVRDFMLLDDTIASTKYERVQAKKEMVANFFDDLAQGDNIRTLDEITDLYIQFVLQRTVGAKDEAAKLLGIDRKTLYRRITKQLSKNQASIQ